MMDMPYSVRQCLYSGISKKIDFLKTMHGNESEFKEVYEEEVIDIEEAVNWYNENAVLSGAYLIQQLNELKEIYKK